MTGEGEGKIACVAWRFWLGVLSNKGGREQRNREEIGAGATWATFIFLAATPLLRPAGQNRHATQARGKKEPLARKPHDFEKLSSPTKAASDWCGAGSVDYLALETSIKPGKLCLRAPQIWSYLICGRRLQLLWTDLSSVCAKFHEISKL